MDETIIEGILGIYGKLTYSGLIIRRGDNFVLPLSDLRHPCVLHSRPRGQDHPPTVLVCRGVGLWTRVEAALVLCDHSSSSGLSPLPRLRQYPESVSSSRLPPLARLLQDPESAPRGPDDGPQPQVTGDDGGAAAREAV